MSNEHRYRLKAMLSDDGTTWDLSPNDKAAIKWALERIAELEAQTARMRLFHDNCFVCKKPFAGVPSPPHCDDCEVASNHLHEWDEAVAPYEEQAT